MNYAKTWPLLVRFQRQFHSFDGCGFVRGFVCRARELDGVCLEVFVHTLIGTGLPITFTVPLTEVEVLCPGELWAGTIYQLPKQPPIPDTSRDEVVRRLRGKYRDSLTPSSEFAEQKQG